MTDQTQSPTGESKMEALTALPTEIADSATRYMVESGADFNSVAAMTDECETHSRRLSEFLAGTEIVDEWGDVAEVEAWPIQLWTNETPEALCDNPSAGGHFVAYVTWAGLSYQIDLTAAQFPEMGWTGPMATED